MPVHTSHEIRIYFYPGTVINSPMHLATIAAYPLAIFLTVFTDLIILFMGSQLDIIRGILAGRGNKEFATR